MKYFNITKYGLLTMLLVWSGSWLTSCDDDITLAPTGNYDNIDGTYGSVVNVTGARELSTISVFGSGTGTGQLYFELTETASEAVTIQLKVDKEALDVYNAANGTSYQMYPEAQVTLANGGRTTVAAGSKRSETVDITVSSNGGVGNVYALPISAEVTAGGVVVSEANNSYIYLVKPFGEIPDSDKGTGVKSVLYIEVNNENILNAGEYTMAGSGKPLFDVVNIFAANINYNNETKRAYVYCNENVSYILKNADQFIRPLQAKGIKVCLTILGNHDEAGVSNLSDAAAADFARELKSYVDVYGLDGIDFDDEYSAYSKLENINDYVPSPGFVSPVGGGAAARLVYECRRLMPDKIISFYDFGDFVASGTVEGIPVGELLDYAYWGLYGRWEDRHQNITGLDISKYNPIPINLNFGTSNGGYRMSYIEDANDQGFGIQMFYDLKSRDYDYTYLFNDVSNVIFGDEVVWSGVTYAKNSTSGIINTPPYAAYIGTWDTRSANSLFYYYSGPWWDWGGSMTTTLTIEENVTGESYTIYGWYGTEGELPLQANYNSENGRMEIPLPQTAIDTETGESWLYLGRNQYPYNSLYFMNYEEQYVGYSALINNDRIAMYANPTPLYQQSRTMSAVQLNAAGNGVIAVKGEIDREIVWQPFNMSKE